MRLEKSQWVCAKVDVGVRDKSAYKAKAKLYRKPCEHSKANSVQPTVQGPATVVWHERADGRQNPFSNKWLDRTVVHLA